MLNEYEEKRYQVELVNYDELTQTTTKTTFYSDDFFMASNKAEKALYNYHHVEIFDSVAGRILFDSSDLD